MAKKAKIAKATIVALEPTKVQQMIYVIRGERVILDRDLAKLYGVETRNLKRQVKRNIERGWTNRDTERGISNGKFTGKTVELVTDGKPKWATRVDVVNGEIVLEVKPMAVMVTVK